MGKMKLFPIYDHRTRRKYDLLDLETVISVFINNNGELVDVKPYHCDNDVVGFVVLYDEYEEII
ncbi:MAG: hypothetical protein RSH79_06955 [Clostridiales bacterium]